MTLSEVTSSLVNFNQNEEARCVHEVFATRASEFADAVAVVSHQGSLTYSELHVRSNGVAQRLTALGVDPGDTVALCADRSQGMIVVLLGILKAGSNIPKTISNYLISCNPESLVNPEWLHFF